MGIDMRTAAVLLFVGMMIAAPASAQLTTNGIADDMVPFFDRVNKCLGDFDAIAVKKKLSPDSYKLALDGACSTELRDLRGLYSLTLERSPNQAYLVRQFDANVVSARAKMVTAYVMR